MSERNTTFICSFLSTENKNLLSRFKYDSGQEQFIANPLT